MITNSSLILISQLIYKHLSSEMVDLGRFWLPAVTLLVEQPIRD